MNKMQLMHDAGLGKSYKKISTSLCPLCGVPIVVFHSQDELTAEDIQELCQEHHLAEVGVNKERQRDLNWTWGDGTNKYHSYFDAMNALWSSGDRFAQMRGIRIVTDEPD